MIVIQDTRGWYVTNEGWLNSYTSQLQYARSYKSVEHAQHNCCPNEIVLDTDTGRTYSHVIVCHICKLPAGEAVYSHVHSDYLCKACNQEEERRIKYKFSDN